MRAHWMKFLKQESGNKHHFNTRPVISLLIGLGFLSVIMLSMIIAYAQNGKSATVNSLSPTGTEQVTQTAPADGMLLAVVRDINTELSQITLFDVNGQQAIVLAYNGGTDITDKYGKIMSMNQIEIGCMVDASYDRSRSKLLSMNISKIAWEYPNVNNLSINLDDKIMKIASTNYKYTKDISILNNKEFISAQDLAEQDVLTVWGNEETIWSVIVTKGHGTVKLRDYEDYLGDLISVGYESLQQITENLKILVREGTFNLTVENGRFSATKSVTVRRNKVTYVSLGDLGPDGLKLGEVTFKIIPAGADLYVDGKLTDYLDPVELNYGNHTIAASLGGYTTYQGSITVDSDKKTIKINLPEAESKTTASASEATGTASAGPTAGTSGTAGTSVKTGSNTDTSANTNAGTDTNTGTNTNTNTNSNTGTNSNSNSSSNPGSANQSSDGTTYTNEDIKFEPKSGDSIDKDHSMYVKSPDGASVYLDGEYIGTAPCSFQKIIGSHVMTFIKDGYKTMSYTIEVTDDGVDAYFAFPTLTKKK
jgi:PEGA domain.